MNTKYTNTPPYAYEAYHACSPHIKQSGQAFLHLIIRCFFIIWVLLAACVRLLWYILRRECSPERYGQVAADVSRRLGGTFAKVGQGLGTRHDLFPDEALMPLQRLHDALPPFAGILAYEIVRQELKRDPDDIFAEFDLAPISCGSIAQVHKAVLRGSGKVVAVKILRPNIAAVIRSDLTFLRISSSLLAFVPLFRNIPLREAVDQIANAISQQTDLCQEAENHRRFQLIFSKSAQIHVPQLYDELCSNAILVMDYWPDLQRLDSPLLSQQECRFAIRLGLYALYRMLFMAGFIHCDLHPGNLMSAPGNAIIILDMGFVVELTEKEMAQFREFFWTVARNDGHRTAEILEETALRRPEAFLQKEFQEDIVRLVNGVWSQNAGEFHVAEFAKDLFAIQRRFGLYGSPNFTSAILSLLIYEGTIKQYYPDLNFQQEAIPFLVVSALAGV